MNLGTTINTTAGEGGVSISSDGLSLYFDTRQTGTSSAINDLWMATRATTDEDWLNPVHLGPTVNSSGDDYSPSISSDELSLYFTGPGRAGYGNYDLWVTERETVFDPWGTPANLGPTINSPGYEIDPGISSDGRVLFFTIGMVNCGSRCGHGGTEIWMTRRATIDAPWGEPANLGPIVNSPGFEDYPNVSTDGSVLFFRRSQSGRHDGGDIWQAPIIPIVDFNSDGKVDGTEILAMADRWGTDDSLCDIGPSAWGDGVVDLQDLIILSEYIGEPVDDPTLVAHWALDEAEGSFAADSAGNCDGDVLNPLWQPDAGHVGGALELDGTCVVVVPVTLDPAIGPFSVLAWVKGGAPGQVIIAQGGGTNWLMLDPSTGVLMTDLKSGGRSAEVLYSDAVITDGTWHRVGFTWDGSTRSLYVDGMLVAEDAQGTLASCTGGLNIGAAHDMAAGTYWTGLIDDVRIYNRAITPYTIGSLSRHGLENRKEVTPMS